ncbi:unnamed protein product [Darwinula stevensoni]|uniref:Ran-GTPase activating protein 1 C-terminal domain-containing protein n=1 Tax=Darwinula stevensoni TaxID=69355 RepID=A0A7R8X7Y1_9CRUS|nr:unnamed protein product [Darwinula stevensoni]CAG0887534.1 unnamed protein product [Darwinula stevensoni]
MEKNDGDQDSTDRELVSFIEQGSKLDTEADAASLIAAIKQCPKLRVLCLQGNSIGVEAAKGIAKALESKPDLERAQWKDMFTGRLKQEIPEALTYLGGGLQLADAHLVELDLSDNALGPIGAEGVKVLLESSVCFSLQELKLNNNGLGIEGGQIVAAALLNCYSKSVEAGRPLSLKTFIAGRNRLENKGAMAFADVFKRVGTMEEVGMPQNGIYHQGVTSLAEAFEKNPNLHTINLSDNTIVSRGARSLKGALAKLSNLKILNLGDCLLKDKGAEELVEGLKAPHPHLEEVILSSNEMSVSSALKIIPALEDATNLKCLNLDGNCFGEWGIEKIRERCHECGLEENLISFDEDEGEPDEEEEESGEESDDEESSESLDEDVGATDSTQTASTTSADYKIGETALSCTQMKGLLDQLEITKLDDTAIGGTLSFAGRGLKLNNEDDAKEVIEAIGNHPNLHVLELEGNTIGVEAAKGIGQALSKHPNLQRARWKDMFTGRLRQEIPDALKFLGEGLQSAGAQLIELDLSDNAFGPVGAAGLKILLESRVCQSLQELRLNNNGLGTQGAQMVSDALLKCHENGSKVRQPLALKTFVCGRNRLENGGAIAFAKVFKTKGARSIAEGLAKGHDGLEELCLDHNEMHKEGALAIVDSLKKKSKLSKLNLNGNNFGKQGCDDIRKKLTPIGKIDALLDLNEDESCDESEEEDSADLVGTIQPEQCTPEAFFSHPSASKFMGLSGDKATVLSQYLHKQRGELEDWVPIQTGFLIRLGSLASEPSIRDDVIQCLKLLLKQMMASFSPDDHSHFTNTVLIYSGLIKSEDKSFRVMWSIEGVGIAMESLVKEALFPGNTCKTLQLFLGRPAVRGDRKNPFDDFPQVKHRLLQALFAF